MPSYDSVPIDQIPVTQYGAPNWGQNVVRPQPGQTIPRNTRGTPTRPGASPWGVGAVPYSATNNLIGQQIGPGESAGTQRATTNATNAQQALTNYTFTPYSGAAPADYTQAQNLMTGANATYGGTTLNYGAGNVQRTAASGALAAGRAAAQPGLNNAAGITMAQFSGGSGSGGAAAQANTADLNASTKESDRYVGGPFADASDTTRARALTTQALERSMSAPDRAQIAAETLALMEERSRPGFEQATRNVNQRAAAMGRRGHAAVGSELVDLGTARERELALARRDLANDAASRTLDDRAALTRLGLDVTGGFGAEDRAGAGVRLGQAGQLTTNANSRFAGEALNANLQDTAYGRMEQAAGRSAAGAQAYFNAQRGTALDRYGMATDESALNERTAGAFDTQENNRVGLVRGQADFARGVGNDLAGIATTNYNQRAEQADRARRDEYDQFGAARDRAGDLTNYMQGERDYDARNRDELRGERDYQYGLNRDARQNEIDQILLDDYLTNSSFDRSYRNFSGGSGVPIPGTSYTAAANSNNQRATDYGQLAGAGAEAIGYGTRRRSGAGGGR